MTRTAAQLEREIAAVLGGKVSEAEHAAKTRRLGLVFKRVAPGFYRGRSVTKINGTSTPVEISVSQQETGKRWYHGVRRIDDDGLISEGEDTYPTKKEAVEALADALAQGFHLSPWGWAIGAPPIPRSVLPR